MTIGSAMIGAFEIDNWLMSDFKDGETKAFYFRQGCRSLGSKWIHPLPVTRYLVVAFAANKVEITYAYEPNQFAGGLIINLKRINGNITREDYEAVLTEQEMFDKINEEK